MKLDQCLFGYDDGHRLLASSLPLGSETSFLTELSDLAPGAIFSRSEGYWTGLPVPAIGRYVLMRTWPAPEMKRPGCVWTHALLIDPILLESVEDLSALQALVIRPASLLDRNRYRETIPFSAFQTGESNKLVDDTIVRKLLTALYAMSSSIVEIASPGELDEPLFAVWSQQWPRLRRNFRFQTATSRIPRTVSSARFDITAILAHQSSSDLGTVDTDSPWLSIAALDVEEGASGSLRRFLWYYGRDVRRQRGSFRPLVEVRTIDSVALADSGQRLIDTITSSFPTSDDAKYLKQDLVNGVLVAHAQIDLFRFMLSNRNNTVFPLPTSSGISKIANFWQDRPDELLQLAEITADAEDAFSRSVFATITAGIQRQDFWAFTALYPRLRERMLQVCPELLLEDAVSTLDDATFAGLLPLISPEANGLIELVSRLLPRNAEMLAKVVFEQFPNIAATQVVLAANRTNTVVADVWFQELARRPTILLHPEVMSHVSRTSLLYRFADSLGWLTQKVVAAGAAPWAAALVNASNDLPDDQKDILSCFLVALAIMTGGNGGLLIIERLFHAVHRQVLDSKLSGRASEFLSPLLPDLGWVRNWDKGLRLRNAIAKAYVRNKWPPHSYSALERDRRVRAMLADVASEVPGGQPYAEAASSQTP